MKIRIIHPRGVIYHGLRVAQGEVIELKPNEKVHAEVWVGAGQAQLVPEDKEKAKPAKG